MRYVFAYSAVVVAVLHLRIDIGGQFIEELIGWTLVFRMIWLRGLGLPDGQCHASPCRNR